MAKSKTNSKIGQVAEQAGVSVMTVSRFFNQPEKLSPATSARVKAAVQDLNYVPNAAARSLIVRQTKTLALVLTDITNPFFTTAARGVEDTANKNGYMLMVGNTDETLKKERAYLENLVFRRVDGVIIVPAPGTQHHLDILSQHQIPAVLLDRKVPGLALDTVLDDSLSAGYQLTKHMLEQGHTRVAFIGGPSSASSLIERLKGYQQAMAEAGFRPRAYLGRYDEATGREIVQKLYIPRAKAKRSYPTALIAANNAVAVGAIAALRELGLGVPEDVALGAVGELEFAARMDPFLTVIKQDAYAMGQRATQYLLERIGGYHGPAREAMLPVELIVRRSSIKPENLQEGSDNEP